MWAGGLSKHSAVANKSAAVPVALEYAINIPYASATSDKDDERKAPSNITLILELTDSEVKTW